MLYNLKILVISDTHRSISDAVSLIEELKPHTVIHLGDMADDCDELRYIFPMQRMICVLGNNDFFNKNYPLEVICEIGKKRFFICHGHKYNVKSGLSALRKKAEQEKADIVLFGHTHQSHISSENGITYLNPGSRHTYAIIETDSSGNLSAQIKEV